MEANEKIRNYLKEHGITQKWLADKTGISYKRLNVIVNAQVKLTADELGKISEALQVSADIFLNQNSLN